jgi:hypothetical protein
MGIVSRYFEILAGSEVILHALESSKGQSSGVDFLRALYEMEPRYIIMYDLSLSALRQVGEEHSVSVNVWSTYYDGVLLVYYHPE